jgi:hypothetical protein
MTTRFGPYLLLTFFLLALGLLGGLSLATAAAPAPRLPAPVSRGLSAPLLSVWGCPNCYTYALGNPTPIARASECPNCILNITNFNQQQRFWASIDGPSTAIDDGDPYNAKYGVGGGY